MALIKAAFEEPPFFFGGGTSNLMLKCVVYSELFEGFPSNICMKFGLVTAGII